MDHGSAAGGAVAAGAIFGSCFLGIIYIAVLVLIVAGVWKTFEKAGKPGWAAIVPVYNIIILLEIAGKPLWWVLMFFIPCVNFVFAILVGIEVAKAFGKSAGFGVGLGLLGFIFYPILGFGEAKYLGAAPVVPPAGPAA